MPKPKFAILAAFGLILIAGAIVVALLVPREDPRGQAILDSIPVDPARAMNEILARARPGASDAGLADLQAAISIARNWQMSLDWPEDDSVDPITKVDLITRGPWPRVDHTEGEDLIADLRSTGALNHLTAFAAQPTPLFLWPEGVDIIVSYGDHLQFGGGARTVTRLAVAEMRLAASDGRIDDLLHMTDGVFALGETQAGRLLGTDLLSGLSIQSLLLTELRHILMEARLNEQTLVALDGIVANRLIRPDWKAVIEAERLLSLATVDGIAEMIERGPLPSRTELAVRIDEFHDDAAHFIENQPVGIDREAWMQSLLAVLDSDHSTSSLFELNAALFANMSQQVSEHQLMADGTRTMIAIERFRVANDRLPTSLGELLPTYLDAIPEDPFTGGQLHYRVDQHAEAGYILYSVGVDATDDGGIADSEPIGWRAALEHDSKGVDFLFTSPRFSIESALDDS